MRYHSLGDVPAKRHAQTRRNGLLLTEEVLGYEGFSGNESILYHLHSPCRLAEIGAFSPIEREEWVPPAHVHRHTLTGGLEPMGDHLVVDPALPASIGHLELLDIPGRWGRVDAFARGRLQLNARLTGGARARHRV